MDTAVAVIVGVLILGVGGAAIYGFSKSTKPPITMVQQAPSPAVAGIQALAMLTSKGIDAYISKKVNAED